MNTANTFDVRLKASFGCTEEVTRSVESICKKFGAKVTTEDEQSLIIKGVSERDREGFAVDMQIRFAEPHFVYHVIST